MVSSKLKTTVPIIIHIQGPYKGKNICIHAQRLLLEIASVSHEICQNPINQRVICKVSSGHLYAIFTYYIDIYSDLFQSLCIYYIQVYIC